MRRTRTSRKALSMSLIAPFGDAYHASDRSNIKRPRPEPDRRTPLRVLSGDAATNVTNLPSGTSRFVARTNAPPKTGKQTHAACKAPRAHPSSTFPRPSPWYPLLLPLTTPPRCRRPASPLPPWSSPSIGWSRLATTVSDDVPKRHIAQEN